jgi:hypothetical protein
VARSGREVRFFVRIDGLTPLLAQSLLAALPKAAPGFSAGMEEKAAGVPHPAAQDPASAHPTTSVQMLVTLAAIDPTIERRRKQAVAAERGIDLLDRLHKEMLAGVAGVERLREIADWSRNVETPDDPVLAALVAEIDLRVRVELAKYDVQA